MTAASERQPYRGLLFEISPRFEFYYFMLVDVLSGGWLRPILNRRFCLLLFVLSAVLTSRGAWIWVEGEKPTLNQMNRHPWWYDQVKRDQFSGGDFISNFDKEKAGEAEYEFTVSSAGTYEFWVRANPLMARLSYTLNGGTEHVMDLNRDKRDEINVALDDKPDLRFIAWSKVGPVNLIAGANRIRFRMTSENNHHGYLDCFVFANEPFQPQGILKPGQQAAQAGGVATQKGWFVFDPKPDPFTAESAIDLRFLNERFAGEHGFIGVKNGDFVHTGNDEPVRFWAVNGPPHDLKTPELKQCARMLAKYGVNMVRVHGGYFDENGEVAPIKVLKAIEIVEAMKAEGIYTHFSIYFPLWLTPKPGTTWLNGYNGKTHPFAALFFNPDFQRKYREWWTALLTTKSPTTGKTLVEEPAVASLEMQNEDSFFFWTFSDQNIPDAELRVLEKSFGNWLAGRYGSVANAIAAWKGLSLQRDAPEEGRLAFRPLWNMFNEKTPRDIDTVQFLFEVQSGFYSETYGFLRKLGFKGPITASNWSTASPEVFGPLEKLSYATGDFIDRHGYFGCQHRGENAEWSIRDGHTYADRSALRFDSETPGKPRQFVHPAMDPHYEGKPSMISETTWNRPNRFRSEAPLYFAAYGALQHSDAIVHFALDSRQWSVKPGYFMQPWTLMSPAMMGQFPATALIFRGGLVAVGNVLARVALNRNSLLRLEGTPLPQDAALDELRLKDIPAGTQIKSGQRLDPLLHYAGRADVVFTTNSGSLKLVDPEPLINHETKKVTSSTGELKLDYGKGLLILDAARAQGISGSLLAAGKTETKDVIFTSELELGHMVAVALDNQPLSTSRKILLQVMSEEKATGFQTESVGDLKRIAKIGTNPWLVKELSGSVEFKRADAGQMGVIALDFNGYPVEKIGTARQCRLLPGTLYYLINR